MVKAIGGSEEKYYKQELRLRQSLSEMVVKSERLRDERACLVEQLKTSIDKTSILAKMAQIDGERVALLEAMDKIRVDIDIAEGMVDSTIRRDRDRQALVSHRSWLERRLREKGM